MRLVLMVIIGIWFEYFYLGMIGIEIGAFRNVSSVCRDKACHGTIPAVSIRGSSSFTCCDRGKMAYRDMLKQRAPCRNTTFFGVSQLEVHNPVLYFFNPSLRY